MNQHDVRRVAVAAHTDPRTVRKYLQGLAVRATCAARIDRALARLKLKKVAAAEATPSKPQPSFTHAANGLLVDDMAWLDTPEEHDRREWLAAKAKEGWDYD